jgi:hypothetical protein
MQNSLTPGETIHRWSYCWLIPEATIAAIDTVIVTET